MHRHPNGFPEQRMFRLVLLQRGVEQRPVPARRLRWRRSPIRSSGNKLTDLSYRSKLSTERLGTLQSCPQILGKTSGVKGGSKRLDRRYVLRSNREQKRVIVMIR